uniref:Uncharacterized protein n=1 Tax=Rhizophora mucronata TaxID=61149 RepID=A0A2P2R2B2_RHIMU
MVAETALIPPSIQEILISSLS